MRLVLPVLALTVAGCVGFGDGSSWRLHMDYANDPAWPSWAQKLFVHEASCDSTSPPECEAGDLVWTATTGATSEETRRGPAVLAANTKGCNHLWLFLRVEPEEAFASLHIRYQADQIVVTAEGAQADTLYGEQTDMACEGVHY